jgi:hypothetical protein
MPRMMRITSLVFVCSLFVVGCGSGESGPGSDASTSPTCGDGVCAASEVGVCQADCGATTGPKCGNSTCENGETPANCPQDCQTSGPICGDMTCDMAGGENSTNCPADCSGGGGGALDCMDPATLIGCGACLGFGMCMPPFTEADCMACAMLPGGGGGLGCVGGAPNGVCDPGEDMTNCPPDCP